MSPEHFELESEDRKRYSLPELPCTIGRSRDSDLGLDLDRISRRHVRLEAHDDGLLITDLGSTNGTFVNHERIERPTVLRPGDYLHLADHGFVLRRRSDLSLDIEPSEPPAAAERAPDTMVGFTALPTGFPVQAPEFYELLNDEQITATAQAIQTADGQPVGLALNGRSAHPKLAADPKLLFRLAEQLGEEVRLAELIRLNCLARADRAALHQPLLLKLHPVECEEMDPLTDRLEILARQYRHLSLVVDLPLAMVTRSGQLQQLQQRLTALNGELCGRIDEPVDSEQLAGQSRYLSWVRLPAAGGPQLVAKVAGIIEGHCRILVDGVDQPGAVQPLAAAGASLFLGQAVARREDL